MNATAKAAWIGVVGVVLTALIGGVFLLFTGGGSNVAKTSGANSPAIIGDHNVVTYNITVHQYLATDPKADADRGALYAKLDKEYDAGWALFYTDGRQIVPGQDRWPDGDIRWETAKIIAFSETSIQLFLPAFSGPVVLSKPDGSPSRPIPMTSDKGGPTVIVPRRAGFKQRIMLTPVTIEIITNDPVLGVVGVIGYKPYS